MTLQSLRTDLEKAANPARAKVSQSFFKTGPGEYGEGDIFLGLTVPEIRKIAHQHHGADFSLIANLLKSKIHEERMLALLMLVVRYEQGARVDQNRIVKFYLAYTRYINNWDLVDLSADKILGTYLQEKNRAALYKLAKSKNLWERRIAIVATFNFIKHNDFKDTLRIAEMLMSDTHDLIQKAVGWMLREVGKRSLTTEEQFLKRHAKIMPRTMLRYAIERFPEEKRLRYLNARLS